MLTEQQAEAVFEDPTQAELDTFLSPSEEDVVSLTIPNSDGSQVVSVQPVSFYDSSAGVEKYDGQITITTYDASGRQIAQTAYANMLTPAQMESLENSPTFSEIQSLVSPSTNDQSIVNIYDTNGNIVAAVASSGQWDSQTGSWLDAGKAVTYTYDAAGKLTAFVQYGNLLTASQIAALAATPTQAAFDALLSPSPFDQRTLTIYNANEQVVAAITPKSLSYNGIAGEYSYGGDVTIKSYDVYGNLAGTITYNTPLTAAQMQALGVSPTLPQLQAMVAPSPEDTINVTIHDENGNVVGDVNSEGLVITTSYDADGNVVSTIQYANRLTPQQEEALADSPTLATLESMLVPSGADQRSLTIYGSDEQVLATVSSQGIATVITYDVEGSQIASQQYATRLSYEQISNLLASPSIATLMSDLEFNAAAGVGQTFYNGNGQVLATVSDTGNVVVNTYDNAGHLTSTIQYANQLWNWPVALSSFAQLQAMVVPSAGDLTSRTIYNGNGQSVAHVSSSGQVTLTSYDAQGDAISTTIYTTPLTSAQMASLGTAPTLPMLLSLLSSTSRTVYDDVGRPVVSIDPEGNASYSFYNDAGELAEVVDADGAVVSYSYDADGHLTQTVKYAILVDISGWLTNAGQLSSNFPTSLPTPPSTSNDRITTQIYNAFGQVVALIDPAGAVTIDTYDAFGEKTSTTHYATPLTSAQVAALGPAPSLSRLNSVLSSSVQDRTTTTIYDVDGNAAATIDPDGYVTTDSYDADGNVVLQTRYATALTTAQLAQLGDTPSLAALQSDLVSNSSDQVTRNYYDGTGQMVARIDADGYLDIFAKNAQTNTKTTTRYATALTADQLAGLTGSESVAELVALLGDNTQNEQTSAAYNAVGQLVSATAADGTVTTYNYDGDGRLTSTTVTPAGGQGDPRATSFQYDAFGNMIASTDADGNTTTYAYNANNQRIESTDPNGNSTWYYYDADGRLLYKVEGQPDLDGDTNAFGNVTAYTYDAFGDVTSTTVYASQLNLLSGAGAFNPSVASANDVASALALLRNNASDPNEVNTFTYTLTGQMASVTDGDGYITNYSYDTFGERIEAQRQVSNAGQAVTVADSTIATYEYDGDGRLYQETYGTDSTVARTTSSTYDAFGQVVSRTDGNGNATFYRYDNLGLQTGTSQVVQGITRATATTYDAFGDVLSTTDALGNVTQYQHNIPAHTTVETSADGVVTTMVKDAFGDVLSVTDGEGDTTSYSYDADGNVLSTTDALGNVSTDQYDADGNLILTTDANGDQVSYFYDADGKVLSKVVGWGSLYRETDYTFDGAGRAVSVNDPMGFITDYGYDADGNVVSEVQDAGGTGYLNRTTTYTYDGNGNVLTKTQGAGTDEATTAQYVYDALGRLSQQIVDPAGLSLVTSYAYDADNNLVATTDPDGNTSYTIYNQANEAVYTVAAAGASGAGEGAVTQNWYNADGNLVSTRAYASIVSSASLAALAGSSDTASTLAIGSQLAASAATDNDPTTYTMYNADGRAIYQIGPSGNVTETRYNSLGQVSETLAYARPIALSGSLIALLQSGTAQSSDIQTALQKAGNSDSEARVSYDFYNADGRLVFTVVPNLVDGGVVGVVNQVEYDAAGRVLAKITYGVPLPLTDLGSGATTASIAQAVTQLNTSSSTRTAQYFYNAAGELVAQTDPNGNTSFTFYDADGNVVATVDATGAVVEYTRDDLGRVIQKTSFSTTVDTSGWLVDGVISPYTYPYPISSPGNDRVVVTTYDALGRVSTVSTYSHISVNNREIQNPDGSWSYVTTTTPTDGDTLTYVYDADSRVIQTVGTDISGYSANRVTNYFYDANGNNTAILNADGYLSTYTYDAAGNRVQSVAYANKVGSYKGGGLASILSAPSPNDEITTNYYDALGNLIGTLDGDHYFTQYTYDLAGQQLSATRYAAASELEASAGFDAVVASLAGTASHQTINTYDSYGDLVTSQNAEGTITTYTYDNFGNVSQTTVAAGTSDARATSSMYDAFGNVVSTTDGLGNVITYTYDMAGNKTSMTDALGNATWYVYDADNRLVYTIRGVDDGTGIQNAMGEVYEQDYDTFGDVVGTIAYSDRISAGADFTPTLSGVQVALGNISGRGSDQDNWVEYTYDLEGDVTGRNDGDDHQTNYTYDGFNDLASSVNPDFGELTTFYTYDDMGNMTSRVDEMYEGGGNSGSCGEYNFAAVSADSMMFGSSGELLVVIRTQEWTYDAFGDVATYTDGDGNTTSYRYDDLNQQVSQNLVVAGVGRETATSYDAYGRVVSSTDALGAMTTYSYNETDRSVTRIAPGGISTTTTYNREGQKIAVADGNGDATSYQYDADGNLLETISPDGGTTINQYDADGNLIQTADPDGNVTAYTYDASGRVLTKTIDPNGLALVTSYTYDGRGLMISKTDPTGVITTYQYDGNGNLTYMDQNAGGDADNLDIQTSYQYNDLNELTYSSVAEIIDGNWQSAADRYSYDALGRMASESTDIGHVQNVHYRYDADGNVTSVTDGNGNVTYYLYNEADQQTYVVAPDGAVTYTTYNADGQVTSVTQYATELSPGALSQIAVAGNDSSSLSSAIQTSPYDRTIYNVYNSADQLVYTIDPNGNVTQSTYNNLGQVAETLAYATPVQLSMSAITGLRSGSAAAVSDVLAALGAAGGNSANARVTYTYYDDMGRISETLSSATLNGQSGYLAVQTQYDADSNVVATIQYGDLIPASQVGGTSTTATVQACLGGLADMHVTRTVYDSAGRKVYSINAAGEVTHTEYDADGRVIATLQYATAIATPSAWTQAGVAAAVSAANHNTATTRETQNIYDAFGNLTKTIDANGNTTSYTYDERGLKLSSTDGDGNTTTYNYDQYGKLISKNSPPLAVASYSSTGAYQGTTTESVVTIYEYDGNGNLVSQTDDAYTPQARTTQFKYDAAGNLIQTIQPDPGAIDTQTGLLVATGSNPTITVTYDAFGEAVGSQDANGNTTYNVYDNDGNLVYAVDGDGYVTGYTYNAYGQQTSVTHYAIVINASGQGWSISQPPTLAQLGAALVASSADRTTTAAYDAQGNKISVTGPSVTYAGSNDTPAGGAAATKYSYDAYGNVTSQSVLMQGTAGAASAVWATTYNYYDALGNKLMSVDPMGYVTANTYDSFGDVLSTTQHTTALATGSLVAGAAPPALPPARGEDHVIVYTYDLDGNVLSKTIDPNGLNLVTLYTYDARGLVTSETDPSGVLTQYTYDSNGNVTTVVQDADGAAPVTTTNYYDAFNELVQSSVSQSIGGTTAVASNSYTYDALGRLVSTTTDTGHQAKILYTYDANGNVISKTDGDGNVTYAFYDADNRPIYAVAANGAITATTYNAEGQVTSTTHYATELSPSAMQGLSGLSSLRALIQTNADDRTSYNIYNNTGQLEYSIDPNGNVTGMLYNAQGQVLETLAYPNPVQLSAAAIANIQSGAAAANADVQAALNAAGNDSGNARLTYTYYDADGRVSCSLSSALLNGQFGYLAVQTEYDAEGNVIAKIQYGDLIPATVVSGSPDTATVEAYLSSLSDMHITRTVYDNDERAVYSIDAAGHVTQTEYDKDGRVTATLKYANPIGTPAAWIQADVAAAVQATNASNTQTRETQNVYDDFGNLTKTIDANGNTTSYTYDERGLKLSSTDGNGNTTYYTYDQYGNPLTQTSPSVAVASYSSAGAYQGTTNESIVTTYTYDNAGNLITQVDASNTGQARTTHFKYDTVGNLIQTIMPDPGAINPQTGLLAATGFNPTITVTYNAFGQAVASEDANGNTAYNVYDHNGNLLYAIDGDGYVTGYTYDAYGEQTSVTRYATSIDPAGQGWNINQPPSLAQVQAALATSSSDRTITTTYDAQGNKLSVTEPAITYTNSDGSTAQGSPVTQYTYDAYGNVTSQSVLLQGTPGTSSAKWATTYNYYDTLGNKLMSVDPMGYVTTNTYDAFGDVLSTTQWATAISTGSLVAGGAIPADPPAGVAATTGLDRITTYTYDNNGNKTGQSVQRSYTNAQGQATVDWDTTTYGYDGDNHLTTITENGITIATTAYDALSRVISVTGPQVEVLISNWQALLEANPSLTLASPSLYVLASQVVSYTYDALGNKLVQTQSSTGSSQTVSTYYQYDNAGHVVAQLTPLDGSGANWTSSQAKFMAYDGNGNLVETWYTLDGDDNSSTTVTTLNTYDGDNQQVASITYRAGIPSPDKATSATYDAFGEVTASGDGVTNNVVTTYDNAGNKFTSTDPKTGEVHTYGYNLAGQLVSDTVPLAASVGGTAQTLYTVDLDGRITPEQATPGKPSL
jgi:YD repeat-containing protein